MSDVDPSFFCMSSPMSLTFFVFVIIKDDIPVYVYTPKQLPNNPVFLVYFHGGWCVLGGRNSVETVCKFISECVFFMQLPETPAEKKHELIIVIINLKCNSKSGYNWIMWEWSKACVQLMPYISISNNFGKYPEFL